MFAFIWHKLVARTSVLKIGTTLVLRWPGAIPARIANGAERLANTQGAFERSAGVCTESLCALPCPMDRDVNGAPAFGVKLCSGVGRSLTEVCIEIWLGASCHASASVGRCCYLQHLPWEV
jgi:hypothetical protein